MKRTASLIIAFLATASMLFAAEEGEFKPSGSPFAKIFFNTNYNLGDQGSAMELKRAYLGYKYKMTENFSGKINIDVGSVKVAADNDSISVEGKTNVAYTAFIKNAYMTYTNGNLSVDVGMIGVKHITVMDKLWGHRYVMKPFINEYDFASSADLGVVVNYEFADFVSADLTVRNGEGYKKVEMDDAYNTGLGVTLTPIDGLTVRGYYDYTEREELTFATSHLLAYQWEGLTVGGEYSTMKNHKDVKDHNMTALDIFALYDITEKIELFVRYNDLNSNKHEGADDAWNYENDGTFIVGGIQYAPHKSVKMALNYQGKMADMPGESSDRIFLNFQFAF